jgi:hypothetical protein
MTWQKGTSGNISGRPKGSAGLARYIAEKTNGGQELVDRLLELSRTGPQREAFAATAALIDRLVGRPHSSSEVSVAVSAPSQLVYPSGWAELDQPARVEWLMANRLRGDDDE